MADVNEKRQAALARVVQRMAELLIEHEDWTVRHALAIADYEDLVIYGDPDAPTPRGILGVKSNR